jgi:hypothetical protein
LFLLTATGSIRARLRRSDRDALSSSTTVSAFATAARRRERGRAGAPVPSFQTTEMQGNRDCFGFTGNRGRSIPARPDSLAVKIQSPASDDAGD